jgi:hypothetical protein
MQMVNLVAGLAWDPEIRGFMAVLTGAVVLPGTVWLVITTNTGIRLGTLIAGAGLFGWMTIMATVWWIYGIGYAGDRPVFEALEIVDGEVGGNDLGFAELDKAKNLRSEELPNAYDLVVAAHDATVAEYGPGVFAAADWEPAGATAAELEELASIRLAWLDFGEVTVDDLADAQTRGLSAEEIEALAEEETARNRATTLSELDAVAPTLVPPSLDELGPWRLLSTADMGEAQASAIAILLDSGDYNFGSQTEFKILNGFTTGGKRGLPDDPNRWDRIYTQFRTALTIKHPTRYAIIQVQAVTEESIDNLPGTAPKRPIVDEAEPVVTVVMIRNLGNLRQLPAFVALGSLFIFLALVYMLHERDKVMMARRAEFAETA